jgi:hypothetical protein
MTIKKFLGLVLISICVSAGLPSCRAKSCDTANNIDGDNGSAKRKKKDLGLFSKKEKRKKRWR